MEDKETRVNSSTDAASARAAQNHKTLMLRLLGEPRILYQESSLTDSLAQKEQALLIYLACQPEQRFSRDHLATLLWSESPQSRARYNLRRALWHLRRALEEAGLPPDDCLAIEGSWIFLAPSAPCQTDIQKFEKILEECFQDPQCRFSVASKGPRRIHEALDLYQGDFLTGFSVLHAPNFEEWAVFERERLFLLLLRALTSLIQGFIAKGEREEAIAACQRLLVLDPLQEDIHRLLMRLYWETGQRSQALRQYRTYRDLLQRELNIEPLEDTQKLYQRILQHETCPTVVSSSLVLTSRITPPSPAPESLPRPRLFALLDQGLSVRLTLLSAPPGYGKTTLLAQWLAVRGSPEPVGTSQDGTPRRPRGEAPLLTWYQVREEDNAPLVFVEGLAASIDQLHLDTGRSLQDEVRDLLSLQTDPRQAVALLVRTIASFDPVPFVMVLDDVERLTSADSHGMIEYLLEHLPSNGHIYLLTRVDPPLPLPRLRVRGQLLELGAAELGFTQEEAITFLNQAPEINLSPTEIVELATRAKGWIAPMWLAANALSRFAANLDDVWEGLFAYAREEVLASQQPEMREFLLRSAVLDWLSPSLCQAVLDLAEVLDGPSEWLTDLERQNLFLRRIANQTTHTELRYAYHPLFLSFLRAELPRHLPAAEIEALHRRAAEAWEERGDLERALSHCLQAGDQSQVARLLEQIAPTYLQQGRLEPLARWLDQLGPAVRDQHPRLMLHAGQLRQAEGRVEDARRLYLQAAADFEAYQNRTAQGDSLLAMAELELLRGRYAEGIELGRQAMSCWEEVNVRRRAAALCTIGQMQAYQGNLEHAEASLKQAEQLIVGQSHPALTFQVLRTQSWVSYIRGDFRRAMALNYLAEHEAGQDVSVAIVSTFRNPTSAILREWGQSEVAGRATRRRMEAARQIQDRLTISHAHISLGNLHLDEGRLAEAEQSFRQAVSEAEATGEDGFHRLCGIVHHVYASFLQGHEREAAEMAEAALRRCESSDASLLELALAQTAVALTHIRDPNPLQSFRRLVTSHRTFDRMDVRYGVFASAMLIGLACLRADHRRQARRYLAKALEVAAAEGYTQTIVASRPVTLPLLLFGLREGIAPCFVSQVLAQMGPEALKNVEEMAQDAEPAVRERAAAALGVVGDREGTRESALVALKRLAADPEPGVRAAAAQARRRLRRSSHREGASLPATG